MNRRLYACVVLLAMTIFSSSSIKEKRTQQTFPIFISDNIRDNHKSLYRLLQDSLINGQPLYRLSVFEHLRKSDDHRLYFVDTNMSSDLGGETLPLLHYPDSVWLTKDTVLLNSLFLQSGSREYVTQVMVHESIHAFINWCTFSFRNGNKNGVNLKFIQDRFTRWEKIADKKDTLDNEEQHIMMSENFVGIMQQCIKAYTNPAEPDSLRETIARALAWGGLEATELWQKQPDKEFLHCVDCWSKSPNARAQKIIRDCCKGVNKTAVNRLKSYTFRNTR